MTLCLSQIEQQLAVAPPAAGEGWTLTLGIRIESEANMRGGWRPRHARFKKQRAMVGQALWARELIAKLKRPEAPLTVLLTRIGKKTLDDDNLCGGFKAVRDEIAAWLGVNDNDPRVTWRYAQERGKGFACRIEIAPS